MTMTPERLKPRKRRIPRIEREAQQPKSLIWKQAIRVGAVSVVVLAAAFLGFQSVRPPDQQKKPQNIVRQLEDLSTSIRNNPEGAEPYLRQAVILGMEYFCQQSNCQPQELEKLKGNFVLQKEHEFRINVKQSRICSDRTADYELYEKELTAYTNTFSGEIYFNTDKLLMNPAAGTIRKRPAEDTFSFAIHESGHSRAPLLRILPDGKTTPHLDGEDLPDSLIRGVQRLIYNQASNIPGKKCYDGYRSPLEEAIVEQNNKSLMNRLNLEAPRTDYEAVVGNWQVILDRCYNGSNRTLFQFHQESQDTNIVGNIGLCLGYPKDQAVEEGDRFLATFFTPIK